MDFLRSLSLQSTINSHISAVRLMPFWLFHRQTFFLSSEDIFYGDQKVKNTRKRHCGQLLATVLSNITTFNLDQLFTITLTTPSTSTVLTFIVFVLPFERIRLISEQLEHFHTHFRQVFLVELCLEMQARRNEFRCIKQLS